MKERDGLIKKKINKCGFLQCLVTVQLSLIFGLVDLVHGRKQDIFFYSYPIVQVYAGSKESNPLGAFWRFETWGFPYRKNESHTNRTRHDD